MTMVELCKEVSLHTCCMQTTTRRLDFPAFISTDTNKYANIHINCLKLSQAALPQRNNSQAHYSIRCQAPCSDRGRRRCTFICGSRNHPPPLFPFSSCLRQPHCLLLKVEERCEEDAAYLLSWWRFWSLAQQKSMAMQWLLSHSLNTLFSWKNGLHFKSMILKQQQSKVSRAPNTLEHADTGHKKRRRRS